MSSSYSQNILSATCILLSILLLSSKPISGNMETLEMVHVLYRHGDRAPIQFYPNDPNKDKASTVWPEGVGQLTKIGKAMEYKVGMWLRNRYQIFVSKVFNPEEINIISTDYDRTLMSAQCVLASFYYADNGTEFTDGLSWMPTPIHTAPKGDDKLLNVDAACPRMSTELTKLQYIKEIKAFYERYKELFHLLSQKSGLNLTTALEVDFLYDTLKVEKLYNLTIPKWAEVHYKAMEIVADFSFKLNTFTHELKRLRGGPLLGVMVENMHKKSHGELPERKMLMFSAHDSTVAILLNTMGVFNDISPPYAATVLVELHLSNLQYFVKIFYQNDSTMASAPHPLTIPGCSFECPLHQWTDLLSNVTPKDWGKECYRPDPVLDHYYIVGLTGLCSILAFILVVGVGRNAYRRWRARGRCGRKFREGYEPFAEVVVVTPYGAIGTIDAFNFGKATA